MTTQPQRIQYITTTGSRYESGRDIKDIAKDVRRDIKAAVKSGDLPNIKTSVRIERYSMGQSLDIEVAEAACIVVNREAWRQQRESGYMLSWADCGGMYSEAGRSIIATLEAIANQYQRVQTTDQPDDYHNVNFHLDVEFSHDLRESQLAAKTSELEPEPAVIDFDYPVFDWTGSAI